MDEEKQQLKKDLINYLGPDDYDTKDIAEKIVEVVDEFKYWKNKNY